jgi:hypothetical protein
LVDTTPNRDKSLQVNDLWGFFLLGFMILLMFLGNSTFLHSVCTLGCEACILVRVLITKAIRFTRHIIEYIPDDLPLYISTPAWTQCKEYIDNIALLKKKFEKNFALDYLIHPFN